MIQKIFDPSQTLPSPREGPKGAALWTPEINASREEQGQWTERITSAESSALLRLPYGYACGALTALGTTGLPPGGLAVRSWATRPANPKGSYLDGGLAVDSWATRPAIPEGSTGRGACR
ncbi:hypothetical protein BK146_04995 [Paenibacillus sp. FSL R7-0333]|nr:hypothetical protein BK146_04995 [Paenibacillus sp. FSL R7-0333]